MAAPFTARTTSSTTVADTVHGWGSNSSTINRDWGPPGPDGRPNYHRLTTERPKGGKPAYNVAAVMGVRTLPVRSAPKIVRLKPNDPIPIGWRKPAVPYRGPALDPSTGKPFYSDTVRASLQEEDYQRALRLKFDHFSDAAESSDPALRAYGKAGLRDMEEASARRYSSMARGVAGVTNPVVQAQMLAEISRSIHGSRAPGSRAGEYSADTTIAAGGPTVEMIELSRAREARRNASSSRDGMSKELAAFVQSELDKVRGVSPSGPSHIRADPARAESGVAPSDVDAASRVSGLAPEPDSHRSSLRNSSRPSSASVTFKEQLESKDASGDASEEKYGPLGAADSSQLGRQDAQYPPEVPVVDQPAFPPLRDNSFDDSVWDLQQPGVAQDPFDVGSPDRPLSRIPVRQDTARSARRRPASGPDPFDLDQFDPRTVFGDDETGNRARSSIQDIRNFNARWLGANFDPYADDTEQTASEPLKWRPGMGRAYLFGADGRPVIDDEPAPVLPLSGVSSSRPPPSFTPGRPLPQLRPPTKTPVRLELLPREAPLGTPARRPRAPEPLRLAEALDDMRAEQQRAVAPPVTPIRDPAATRANRSIRQLHYESPVRQQDPDPVDDLREQIYADRWLNAPESPLEVLPAGPSAGQQAEQPPVPINVQDIPPTNASASDGPQDAATAPPAAPPSVAGIRRQISDDVFVANESEYYLPPDAFPVTNTPEQNRVVASFYIEKTKKLIRQMGDGLLTWMGRDISESVKQKWEPHVRRTMAAMQSSVDTAMYNIANNGAAYIQKLPPFPSDFASSLFSEYKMSEPTDFQAPIGTRKFVQAKLNEFFNKATSTDLYAARAGVARLRELQDSIRMNAGRSNESLNESALFRMTREVLSESAAERAKAREFLSASAAERASSRSRASSTGSRADSLDDTLSEDSLDPDQTSGSMDQNAPPPGPFEVPQQQEQAINFRPNPARRKVVASLDETPSPRAPPPARVQKRQAPRQKRAMVDETAAFQDDSLPDQRTTIPSRQLEEQAAKESTALQPDEPVAAPKGKVPALISYSQDDMGGPTLFAIAKRMAPGLGLNIQKGATRIFNPAAAVEPVMQGVQTLSDARTAFYKGVIARINLTRGEDSILNPNTRGLHALVQRLLLNPNNKTFADIYSVGSQQKPLLMSEVDNVTAELSEQIDAALADPTSGVQRLEDAPSRLELTPSKLPPGVKSFGDQLQMMMPTEQLMPAPEQSALFKAASAAAGRVATVAEALSKGKQTPAAMLEEETTIRQFVADPTIPSDAPIAAAMNKIAHLSRPVLIRNQQSSGMEVVNDAAASFAKSLGVTLKDVNPARIAFLKKPEMMYMALATRLNDLIDSPLHWKKGQLDDVKGIIKLFVELGRTRTPEGVPLGALLVAGKAAAAGRSDQMDISDDIQALTDAHALDRQAAEVGREIRAVSKELQNARAAPAPVSKPVVKSKSKTTKAKTKKAAAPPSTRRGPAGSPVPVNPFPLRSSLSANSTPRGTSAFTSSGRSKPLGAQQGTGEEAMADAEPQASSSTVTPSRYATASDRATLGVADLPIYDRQPVGMLPIEESNRFVRTAKYPNRQILGTMPRSHSVAQVAVSDPDTRFNAKRKIRPPPGWVSFDDGPASKMARRR